MTSESTIGVAHYILHYFCNYNIYFSFLFSLNPSSQPMHNPRLSSKGRRRTCGAQPVNYWSFNEWNCTPSRHPHRFLPSILTWRIDIAYLALPRRSALRLHRELARVTTSPTVSFSNARCASAIALLVAHLLGEGCVSLFLINNRRGSFDASKNIIGLINKR